MNKISTPTSQQYRRKSRKTIRLALAALAPLLLLLAACVPQASGCPSPDVTLSLTAIPQKVTPTASLQPTSTQSGGNISIDRTTRPTPALPDELVMPTSGAPVVGEVPVELLDDIITNNTTISFFISSFCTIIFGKYWSLVINSVSRKFRLIRSPPPFQTSSNPR